ncbi:ligase-associated DNA damage response endonuclease PdeM [Oscillatoria amoena NRMC-F 0135]|nr:ligase-associated DNA damage response endonuclease PdeM [Oscillatoria amoena NRMC-F 0135]
MEITVSGEQFILYWQKAILWKNKNMIVLADLHLGKVNHFRKSGIPVPLKVSEKNLEQLIDLIRQAQPCRVLFLGDLFHSSYNTEWEAVRQLIQTFVHISFELVVGNHDIMSRNQYDRSRISVYESELREGPFIFSHSPVESVPDKYYNISGHLHPGISLSGKGRQSVTLPCYYFGKQHACLPAFGMFTGLARIKPLKTDRIFAIVDQTIVAV